MIELVLTVCLLATPASCRDERTDFAANSLVACMTQGQFYAARWLAEHPAFSLSRWRCEPSGAHQEPI
ncbi:MAG TPA: hypothetical protein VE684_06255 [Crenalkalicoccus sp.]|jgi:hypothetical protein|nr:hypothetical protein [Crenalkalicoccus sp.]